MRLADLEINQMDKRQVESVDNHRLIRLFEVCEHLSHCCSRWRAMWRESIVSNAPSSSVFNFDPGSVYALCASNCDEIAGLKHKLCQSGSTFSNE